MSTFLLCDGVVSYQNIKSGLNSLNFSDGTIAVVPKCSTGWTEVAYVPPSTGSTSPVDFEWLQTTLEFDVTLFAELMGFCVLLFIIGYSTGHVARNLNRV